MMLIAVILFQVAAILCDNDTTTSKVTTIEAKNTTNSTISPEKVNKTCKGIFRSRGDNAVNVESDSFNRTSKVRLLGGKKFVVNDPMIPRKMDCKNPIFLDVDPTRKEFLALQTALLNFDDSENFSITKIQRIFSLCVWRKFFKFRQRLEAQRAGAANETYLIVDYLYEGVRNDTIAVDGYDERLQPTRPGLPTGLYSQDKVTPAVFSTTNATCPITSRYLYLSRVGLGNVYPLPRNMSMDKPPAEYHSMSVTNRDFVTYYIPAGHQIYPEYYVEFKFQNINNII